MAPSVTQVVLVVALIATLGLVWYFEGRDRWRAFAARRLLYGVPWGTAVTVGIVVAFYLFAQSGIRAWSNPVIYPFVSWSFFYPLGVLTAGFAHANPDHLVGNMSATLVLAPIAEFAWSHYARSPDVDGTGEATGDADEPDPASDAGEEVTPVRSTTDAADDSDPPVPDGGRDLAAPDGLLETPWVRAVVVFPAALLAAALLTSLFSMGPGLGFSGAVYALIGFALVAYPLTTVLAVVGAAALGVLYDALTQPIVRAGVESGAPSPPAWAGVAFQAHALGFLLGVLAGVALLAYRHRRPDPGRVFFATLTVGLVQSLWLLVWPGTDDVYTLYRGAGVVALLAVTLVVTLAVAVPRADRTGPSGTLLGVGWLVLAGAALVGVTGIGFLLATSTGAWLVPVAVLGLLLVVPGLAILALGRDSVDADARRKAGLGLLLALTVLVALPGVLFSSVVLAGDPVPNDDAVTVGGYTVTYAEEAPSARQLLGLAPGNESPSTVTGVIVVNEAREIWTVGVRESSLAHSGNGTVQVGGVGWNETIRAQRTGWEVAGGDTVYAVDLFHDGERVRSFASAATTARAEVAGHSFAVVPTDATFAVRVTSGGSVVDAVPVPATNESTAVGDVEISTESDGETRRIFAVGPDSRALIAVEETY